MSGYRDVEQEPFTSWFQCIDNSFSVQCLGQCHGVFTIYGGLFQCQCIEMLSRIHTDLNSGIDISGAQCLGQCHSVFTIYGGGLYKCLTAILALYTFIWDQCHSVFTINGGGLYKCLTAVLALYIFIWDQCHSVFTIYGGLYRCLTAVLALYTFIWDQCHSVFTMYGGLFQCQCIDVEQQSWPCISSFEFIDISVFCV